MKEARSPRRCASASVASIRATDAPARWMATWCTATGTRLRAGAQAIWEGSGAVFQSGYEAIRKPDDPETFDEYLQTRDPLVAIKMRLNMIVKSFDNDILGTHINGMKWAVIDVSASPARFLLSDRPVEFSN